MDSIDKLSEKEMPLVAVVEPVEVEAVKPVISMTRRQDYKQSKAIHSSRSFLTSISLELDKIYPLVKEKSHSGIDKPVTFGTILNNAYYQNPDPLPIFKNNFKKLKLHFTDPEWNYLETLHETVNGQLHLPLDPENELKYLILPDAFSGNDKISQRIAKKSKVVSDLSHLVVKNEGSVSGGSPEADKKL